MAPGRALAVIARSQGAATGPAAEFFAAFRQFPPIPANSRHFSAFFGNSRP